MPNNRNIAFGRLREHIFDGSHATRLCMTRSFPAANGLVRLSEELSNYRPKLFLGQISSRRPVILPEFR